MSLTPTLDLLRSRREDILAVARRRDASRIRVFGSVAREEAQPGSDVDFLVGFEPEATLLDQVGLINDLQELLGVDVDVVSEGGLRPRHDSIRRQAVDLWADHGADSKICWPTWLKPWTPQPSWSSSARSAGTPNVG